MNSIIQDKNSEIEFYLINSFEIYHYLPIYNELLRQGIKAKIVAEPCKINTSKTWFDYKTAIKILRENNIDYCTKANPNAKIAITTQRAELLSKYKNKKINLSYGFGWTKNYFINSIDSIKGFDYKFVHGEIQEKILNDYKTNSIVKIFGYPKYNDFLKNIPSKESVLNELDVKTNKPNVLKILRENNKPFGGIQVILVGDFFQLPPVKIEQIDGKDFCFNSKTWNELNLTTIYLTKVRRQSEKRYIEALNNVRVDKTSVKDLKVFYERDFEADYEPDKNILRIFGTNRDADSYNTKCMKETEEKPYVFNSTYTLYQYSLLDDTCSAIEINEDNLSKISQVDKWRIEQFERDCKAPHNLELKEGCRVMLLKNLDLNKGLVNGACGTIKNLTTASIDVLFDNEIRLNLEPIEFEYQQEGKPKITRKQYPLRLAYGITIHKSQGMTFDKLVVNFNKIFDYVKHMLP